MIGTHDSQTTGTQFNENYLQDGAPITIKVLDFLMRNAHGVHLETVMQTFNLTDSGVRSAIGRIRKKKNTPYQIMIVNKVISIKVRGKWPVEKDIIENIEYGNAQIGKNPGYNFHKKQPNKRSEPEKENAPMDEQPKRTGHETYDAILDLLEQYPQGIKTDDLLNEIGIERQQLFNAVYSIRKKGFNIFCKKGVYQMKPGKPQINHQKNHFTYKNNEVVKTAPRKKPYGFIPDEYKEAFENLPDNDKIECINLMKKSIYHRNAAIALMEANQTAFDFCSALTKGVF